VYHAVCLEAFSLPSLDEQEARMIQTDRDPTATRYPFSLTLDQYGHLWLHAKVGGVEVAIDLADKDQAFAIMAAKMSECGFEYRPIQEHEDADNDDQVER
jgi:hypothetical protein